MNKSERRRQSKINKRNLRIKNRKPNKLIQFIVSDSIDPAIVSLELSNVVLSDEEGNTLYSEYGSGYFFVNGVNAMRIGGGIESVSVDLYNAFAVGGVQFTIAFDPGLVILDEINTTPRSNAMDLSYSDTDPGMITVLLYSFNLDSVIDNSGSILSLEFSYLSEYSGTVNLDLSNVAVSNMDGITEEVAREALYKASAKLPIKTKFIKR